MPLVSARIWIGIQVSHSYRGYPLPTVSPLPLHDALPISWSHPATRTGLCALSCGPLHATGLGPHMDWDSSFALQSRLTPSHRLPIPFTGPIHWRMVPSSDSNWPLRTVLRATSCHWSRPAYGLVFKFRTPIEATPSPQSPLFPYTTLFRSHGPIQRLELASAHCPAGHFMPLVSARIWIGIQVSHSNRG